MQATTELALLNTTITLPDLQIGQAMDIAKIPERFNEKRLSALITHLTGDIALAKTLTVQERYYILLNHLAMADNKYATDSDYESYMLPVSDVAHEYNERGLTIKPLLGRHAELLEAQCENVFDWLCGQISCQLSGDFNDLIGLDWKWEPLDAATLESISDHELNETLQARFKQITVKDDEGNGLSEYQFNVLADLYYNGVDAIAHFVDIGINNEGINLLGGDGQDPSRFRALASLRGVASNIARCLDV